MKKFLTFLTLLTLFTLTAGAGTVTYLMGKDKPGTWTSEGTGKAASITTSDGFTISLGSANVNNADYIAWNAGLNANGQANRFTISHSSYSITEIEVSCTNATLDKVSIADGGGSMTTTDDGFTWSSGTGSNSVSFQYASGTGVKQMRISQLVITYEGGSQTTVATPVITLNPASGPYFVGDNVKASIACDTEGATLTYSLDNGSTWQAYSSAVTIPSTTAGSVKIIAKAAKDNEEKTAEKTVAFGPSAATVAEILQLANHTTFKFTGNLVVSGKSGNQLYAQDATGGMHFYGSTPAYDFGDVIPAGFVARFVADYNGAPELDNMSGMLAATETAELNAETLTPPQITTNNENAFIYAVIKNATIASNTITANGETVTVQNTFNVTLPTDGKSYDFYGITNWNNGGRFIPLSFEETYIDPGEGYFIVGSFCDWKKVAGYKLTEQNGKLVLDANLPAPTDINNGLQFKVVYAQNEQEDVWLGAQADGAWYGIDRDHTSVTLVNGSNLRIAAGGQTHFEVTINGDTKTLTVSRNAQAYFKCDKINDWTKVAMTATDNGWTITEQLEAGAKFGFEDEWGTHRGNNWTIKPEHYGDNYNIPLGNENTPIMQDAGYYKIDVNSALSVMHVNKEFAINCSANPNGGGNVTAKVGGETVESAMAGETVTIEYTTANGYTFNNIKLNGTALEAVEGVYSFTMPNADANVVANFTAQSFAITVVSPNGTTTCPETATTGSPVSFTVTPETDYEVISVTASFVNGENTTNVPVTYDEENDEYSFNMPPFPVTVTVNYKAPFQSKMYQLIKSAEDLEINKTYLIADKAEAEYVLGFANGDRGGVVNVIPAGGIITSTSEMAVITLLGSEGHWQLVTDYGNLGAKSSTNGQLAYNTDATATISINEETGAALITFSNRTDKNILCFNLNSANNNPFFGCYGSNTSLSKDVYIFKEVTPETKTLAELVAAGQSADGKLYTISDANGLLGVYKSGNTVWFKDDNGYATPDVCNSSDNNYEIDLGNGDKWYSKDATFDQSNWIEVVFPSEANYDGNYVKNLTGTYSYNGGNPKLTVTKAVKDPEDVAVASPAYTPNRYCIANFGGSQEGFYMKNGSQVECTYFFVTPKPQEYAEIILAVYNNGTLSMPAKANTDNGISGTINVDLSKNGNYVPVDGTLYTGFNVIVSKVVRSSMLKADGEADGDYKVSPVNLTAADIPTAISTVAVSGDVKSVKYVNVAGVVSDRPFQGVNIVVTEYTDGSRTTAKMVR